MVLIQRIKNFDKLSELREITRKIAKETATAQEEDRVVVTAGIPFSQQGNTNTVMIEKI